MTISSSHFRDDAKHLSDAITESLVATEKYATVNLDDDPVIYSVTDGLFAIAQAIEELSQTIREHS
tara:strand:- start:422 stop:619 length:198 start_codon:yes stop_codon:yes gene_type:complete